MVAHSFILRSDSSRVSLIAELFILGYEAEGISSRVSFGRPRLEFVFQRGKVHDDICDSLDSASESKK